jgi:TfoX/Sxy family transcriptional regulator of competence genes
LSGGIGMQIPKPSDEDKQFFQSIVPQNERVEVKPMFGNLGAFVNGNMFAGLFGSDVGVRLDALARDELAAVQGTGSFGPAERPMTAYLSLPAAWRDQPALAASWVAKALDHVAELPPKKPKARKAAKGG